MTDWLTPDEQASWRAWLAAARLLPERLNRDLLEESGLSLADYDILVHLSEAPDRRLRMSELAELTLSSRSRLSHQIDRMESAGLVERGHCDEDRRGTWATLTAAGWERIRLAAPGHVASVRRHLVDLLGEDDFAVFGRLCDRITAGPEGDGRDDL